MKTSTPILLFLFLTCFCGQEQRENADSFSSLTINSKTVALDTMSSKGLTKCDEIKEEFNDLNSCIIQNGSTRFIRIYTVTLAKNQELLELYRYLPMGAISTSKQELLNDTTLFTSYKLSSKYSIKANLNKGVIIDNKDTLEIVDHWRKEKLLFVANAKLLPKGQTVIYGYRL
jgi:hypothetical protein